MTEKTEAFWDVDKDKCNLVEFDLKTFLEDMGFGLYKSVDKRTADTVLFQNDNGVIKLHNEITVKKWVTKFLKNIDKEEFVDFWEGGGAADQRAVQVMWQKIKSSGLKSGVLSDLEVYSEDGFADTEDLRIFKDSADVAHVFFRNGVVRITADNIEIIPRDKVAEKGAVWESRILRHDIKLTDKDDGAFSKFFSKAMQREKTDEKSDSDDWRDNYHLDEDAKLQLESLRTSYGYMLHSNNNASDAKLIFYIDENSTVGAEEGGNGKSLIMDSVKHFKKKAHIDGKKWQGGGSGGSRFQFSNVELDTQFIFIDDIESDFDFTSLFSMVTGDMEIEGKGTNKFVIPADRKAKMGITTNYVVVGSSASHKRRLHVVEFGSYWNQVTKQKERTTDEKHLGQTLFEWKESHEEWVHFYNFGFRCIQQYIRDGLTATSNESYINKAIMRQIEGKDGDGQGSEWLVDWVKSARLIKGCHLKENKGISENYLWTLFKAENPEILKENDGDWDKKRLSEAVYMLASKTEGWHYNKHLEHKGDSKSKRRWLQGARTSQQNHLVITTDFDEEWLSDIDDSSSFERKKEASKN